MYDQTQEDAIFVMLYAVVTVLAALGCVYLLFRRGNAAHRPVSAKQLAAQSGYRSYSTFSVAFKQRMGKSVKEWMNEEESA